MPGGAKPRVVTQETQNGPDRLKENGSVTVTRSFTKNLGEYNSAVVSISITTPIEPTKEEILRCKATVKVVNETIERMLEVELDKLNS